MTKDVVIKSTALDSTHEQMKKENAQLRKALAETNKNYVEVVNENLELKAKVEQLERMAYER